MASPGDAWRCRMAWCCQERMTLSVKGTAMLTTGARDAHVHAPLAMLIIGTRMRMRARTFAFAFTCACARGRTATHAAVRPCGCAGHLHAQARSRLHPPARARARVAVRAACKSSTHHCISLLLSKFSGLRKPLGLFSAAFSVSPPASCRSDWCGGRSFGGVVL